MNIKRLDDLLSIKQDKLFHRIYRPTVVIPMAENEEVLDCVAEALESERALFILIGRKSIIQKFAEERRSDLSPPGCTLIEECDEKAACEAAARLCAEGRAQVLMKGLVQTSTFTRAVLNKQYNLMQPGRLISHTALFEISGRDRLFILSDAAINIAPEEKQKAEILRNALEAARTIGLSSQPGAILLSAVEKITEKMPSTVHAAALAVRASKGEFGPCIVEGPLSFDAALSAEAAAHKGIESRLAGKPDIIIAPNIEAANILYKCLTWGMGARSAGVLAGVRIPVVLTSRADSAETKTLSLALGIHMARRMAEE